MFLETQFYLKRNPEYITFLRNNSFYYKFLNRYPEKIKEFEKDYKNFVRHERSKRLSKTIDYVNALTSILSNLD